MFLRKRIIEIVATIRQEKVATATLSKESQQRWSEKAPQFDSQKEPHLQQSEPNQDATVRQESTPVGQRIVALATVIE